MAALHGLGPRTRQPRRTAEQVELDRLRRCDLAPAQLWARLLNDGVYLCSTAAMW